MPLSLALACLWVVLAAVLAMLPSRRSHWPAAWLLIALGLPLLGYVLWEAGALAGLLVFAAGASVLRWPLFYLWRRAVRAAGRLRRAGPRAPP